MQKYREASGLTLQEFHHTITTHNIQCSHVQSPGKSKHQKMVSALLKLTLNHVNRAPYEPMITVRYKRYFSGNL